MRIWSVIFLAFVFLAAQGVGRSGLTPALSHEISPALTSVAGQVLAVSDISRERGDHRHRGPHHCAQPCPVSAPLLRMAGVSRVILKKAPVKLAITWPATLQVPPVLGAINLRAAPDRRGNGAPFKAVYARTGRQRL
jgi:hypothetical protein